MKNCFNHVGCHAASPLNCYSCRYNYMLSQPAWNAVLSAYRKSLFTNAVISTGQVTVPAGPIKKGGTK